jgi:hypothetical protein
MKSETYLGLDAQLKLRTWIDLATDSNMYWKRYLQKSKRRIR